MKKDNKFSIKYSIVCENCHQEYSELERIDLPSIPEWEIKFFPGGLPQRISSILYSMNTKHDFGSSKKNIRCPYCNFIPSWNIETTKELLAYKLQALIVLLFTMSIGFIFIRIAFIFQSIFLRIILVILFLLLHFLSYLCLDIAEKIINNLYHPNKTYKPIENNNYPIVEQYTDAT